MVAPVKPALADAFANDSWVFVPAIADKTTPTVAEIEAATGFNFSCHIFGDTQESVTSTTEKVTRPRLNCERETFEKNGSTTYAMADLMIAFRPQDGAGDAGKAAWEALDDYAEGFLVRRQGKDATTAIVASDFVDVIPAQLGEKVPTKTGNDAAGVYAFNVPVSITSKPAWNVEVQAA